jgi:alkylated DNA repair dioxygenase AlkB
MAAAFQGSLLDLAAQAGPGPLGESVRRRRLAHGAWVDTRPGWLAGADALFGRLLDAVPWRAERRQMYDRVVDVPRLLCFYGDSLTGILINHATWASGLSGRVCRTPLLA